MQLNNKGDFNPIKYPYISITYIDYKCYQTNYNSCPIIQLSNRCPLIKLSSNCPNCLNLKIQKLTDACKGFQNRPTVFTMDPVIYHCIVVYKSSGTYPEGYSRCEKNNFRRKANTFDVQGKTFVNCIGLYHDALDFFSAMSP